ncbi:hypothetical protein F546_05200 [Vibrio paracholerae 877-163]|nr:hypothetical protein F546_05200 [Vibrio paracholerae 877-163]
MSMINLEVAKQYLNVIHDFDDANLQLLLDAAESEAEQFINQPLYSTVPEGGTEIPASLKLGVLMLMQAAYQASPDDANKLRMGAEIKLTPFRVGWGI